MGGGGGRQGPARLWHDYRAPGCHFVTVAVVAVGGGRVLRHRPDGPGRRGGRGGRPWGLAVAFWAPMGVRFPRQRPEVLLERRGAAALGGRRSSARPPARRAPSLPAPPLPYFVLLRALQTELNVALKTNRSPRFCCFGGMMGGWGERLSQRFLFGGRRTRL